MNKITRRALTLSRKQSEYYLVKQGFRVEEVEEKPEEETKESKPNEKK